MGELLRAVPAPGYDPVHRVFQGGRLDSQPERGRRAQLTAREMEVLELLARGLPNKLICRELDIAGGTVKSHVAGILAKLRVATRVQAVIVAMDQGLVGSNDVAHERHAKAATG